MRRLLALSTLVLAAACGGSEDQAGDSSTPTPTAAPTSASAAPTGPQQLRALTGDRWSLTQVQLAVGDRLEVVNADPEKGHNVSVPGVGTSETLSEGETFTLTFDKAGTFELVCTIHPGMDATVTVR